MTVEPRDTEVGEGLPEMGRKGLRQGAVTAALVPEEAVMDELRPGKPVRFSGNQ